MKQKLFTFLLALVASVSAIYAQSGTCGNSLTWNLNAETGVLTISGTGAMEDYYYNDVSPWYDYRSSILSVIISDGVTSIGEYAFYYCSSLTSITIPNSVTSIGEDAFASCFSLTSVTIPNSVTSIGYVAFSNCSSLTSINVDSYNSKYSSADGVLFNKDKTTLITYPGGKQGAYTIPNSVTSIVDEAFYDCISLTSITCEAATPPTIGGTYTFARVSKSIPVYVPCGCVEAYKAASGWSDFTNLQEPLAEYSIEVYVNETIMGTAKVTYNTFCEGAQISATPNLGYHFVRWSDGNTENPRSFILTQDTIFTAIYAPNFYSIQTQSNYTEWGATKGDTTVLYLDSATIQAVPNYGYHFTKWNDGNTANPRLLQVTEHATYIAIFDKNIYAISLSCNEEQGSVKGAKTAEYLDMVTISATPNLGYHFVQWSDGNTENSRTLELTQDTILTAEFAQSFSGQCGDNLYWEFIDDNLYITGNGTMYNYIQNKAPWTLLVSSIKSLSISEGTTSIGNYAFSNCSSLTSITIPNSVTSIGNSAFEGCSNITSVTWNAKNCNSYNFGSQVTSFELGNEVEVVPSSLCKGMEKLTSVTIPNSVKTIGTSAFKGCIRLGKVSLGKNLETIGANAFAECTRLYDIYTYATYPPFAEESSFANYNVYVYVPCKYQRDYTLDIVWGKFKFIECISSDNVTTDEIVVTPSENEANVIWPSVNDAASYELVIKDKDGNTVCTLIFNANGQLTSIAFNAPSRNGAPAQTQSAGFSFTITGLDSGTNYDLTLTAKDNSGNAIQTETISFVTTGGNVSTDIDQLQGHKVQSTKVLRNGQVLILRNGKTYTMQGQEVK